MGLSSRVSNGDVFNDLSLNRWEIQVLKCVRKKPMTERKIAKQLSVNDSIISDSITNLMLRGFVQRFRKRRMHFSREYFVATMEGLEALEAFRRRSNNIFWNDLSSVLKDNVERILNEFCEKSLAFRLTFGAAKSSYKIAKFILK